MAKSRQPSGRFLHYDPERVDYAVSEAELERLRRGEHPLWKDVFLVMVALAVPTLVNAVVEIANQAEFKLNAAIFLNTVVGIVSLMFAGISGLAWHQHCKGFVSTIDSIRNKPRFEIPPEVFNAGLLPRAQPDQPNP